MVQPCMYRELHPSILIDYVTEAPNFNGDDHAALLIFDPVRLAVQVEEQT